MSRRSSPGPKMLLAVAATVFALAVSEVACRMIVPAPAGHGSFFTANGLEVPLGEIIAFVSRGPGADASNNVHQDPPHGMMLANLKMRMGYVPKPRWDYFDENGCISVDTNSLGLRDEEFDVAKKPHELRILTLGDSMTYGQGVRLDLTWPQVLEARLRKERGTPVEVINAGFAAGQMVCTPDGYDRWVDGNGILFEPDIVIVGLCLNDLGPIPMLTYPFIKVEPVLGGYSRFLDRIVQAVRQRMVRNSKHDLGGLVDDHTPAWVGTRRGLRALGDLLAPRGIPLVVAVFPMMSQLEPDLYPCRSLHRLVVDWCRQERIRCLDLLPAFLGLNESDLWVHPCDQHANHVGHAIQAAWIHDYLQREGLLAPP